ncbi:MAG: hypothetical protein GY778_06600 [bacterium]|nr:hypothetical protein [bacterium]
MSSHDQTPVVLTGCGWVTPMAGGTIRDVLSAARAGEPVAASPEGYAAVADEWPDDFPKPSGELKRNRAAAITAVALEHARRQAGLDAESHDPVRVGLVLGCALAGQGGMIAFADEVRDQTARFVSPIHFPETVGNYVAGALARSYGIRGANLTLSSGVASGLDALIEAHGLLQAGAVDLVFAGGTDVLTKELATGLAQPGAVLSEGACWFTLERADQAAARGAAPLATITRTGLDADARNQALEVPGTIVSNASADQLGSVRIESWIGHCFAALAPAAVAAAIGGAQGLEVPWIVGVDPVRVSSGAVQAITMTQTDGPPQARALTVADTGTGHSSAIELTLPAS